MTKKIPESYQPPDCRLTRVSNYASQKGLVVTRIYQLFQEDKLEIVTVDGAQFVKTELLIVATP